MLVTKEFLKSIKLPDIASTPISSVGYINKSKNFTKEKLRTSRFTEVLSPLQQELKFWHDKLSQLHIK